MIDVGRVLQAVPHFTKFSSIDELHALVDTLKADPSRFKIEIAGTSETGAPIHHVRCGSGAVKALFVGWPHPNEPIGGMTVFSLLTLLRQGHPALLAADVEWHIVPCIDPDGARLNEGWTQQPFSLEKFMKSGFRQEPCDQVERSFPIHYKRFHFDRPIPEARILQTLLEKIRPDFFYSLHNARAGGVKCYLTRGLDSRCYRDLHDLFAQQHIPLHLGGSPLEGGAAHYADAISELFTTKKYYDYLETISAAPEEGLHQAGACSWEYLAEIQPDAVTFVMELPYFRHPASTSKRLTAHHLRQFKLRTDADNKFLITRILEEWDKVHQDLDTQSPLYRKVFNSIVSTKGKLLEGLPSWEAGTSNILFNSSYARTMTESDLFYICMYDRFYGLCNSYEIVRLLKVSKQTPQVQSATTQLEALFDEALRELESRIDFNAFEPVDHDALARAQLGGGLIVLNALTRQ